MDGPVRELIELLPEPILVLGDVATIAVILKELITVGFAESFGQFHQSIVMRVLGLQGVYDLEDLVGLSGLASSGVHVGIRKRAERGKEILVRGRADFEVLLPGG